MLLLFWVITVGLALNANLALADGIKACIRLMILVLLLLESEFPRANCITLSQVSILEPYVGNSVGIPLVPSKPHFPKFSYVGSCAWSMNQKVHVFGMIMN